MDIIDDRNSRFRSILAGDRCMTYDKVLFERDECVVAPSLGSIVPNWLLIIPRKWQRNFREWKNTTGHDPVRLMSAIVGDLQPPAESIIWFEHGARDSRTTLSCGVDHAHLHLIVDAPFLFDAFVERTRSICALDWCVVPATKAYKQISSSTTYLVVGDERRAVVAEDVESVGSQFFRRIVASLVGEDDGWDYRLHPFLENIEHTTRRFGTGWALDS